MNNDNQKSDDKSDINSLSNKYFSCSFNNTTKGIILIIISAFVFSIMTLVVQATGEKGIPSFEIMAIRCIIQTFYGGYWCLWININPFGTKNNRMIPIIRGILGPIAAGFLYYGATHIPIADATVLMFSSPIWTPFFARCVSKESFRCINFLSIFFGFMGVIFISQPSFIFDKIINNNNTSIDINHPEEALPGSFGYIIAAIVCVLGAMCNSFSYTIIRRAGTSIHPQVLVFYYGLIGIFVISILLLIFQGLPVLPPDLLTWIYLFIISICGCIGQTTVSAGAQLIDATKVSVIRNLDICFVLIWQILLLHEIPTIWSIIGLILITGCTIVIALTKSKTKNNNNEITEELNKDIDTKDIEMEKYTIDKDINNI